MLVARDARAIETFKVPVTLARNVKKSHELKDEEVGASRKMS